MLKVLSINCNGIRAAYKKDFFAWVASMDCDVLCLQEVRADKEVLADEKFTLNGYVHHHVVAEKKGYSGVSIYSRLKIDKVVSACNNTVMTVEGRWIEVIIGKLHIVSLYLPSGSSGDIAQCKKNKILDWLLPELQKKQDDGDSWIICGDFNIAHTNKDIKNWRGNQKNSGFLPHERAWLDAVFSMGWVDVFRTLNNEEHQYTWWSNRGQAWANNVGWRIDYQITTKDMAEKAQSVEIYKNKRFSDHAPLIIKYD